MAIASSHQEVTFAMATISQFVPPYGILIALLLAVTFTSPAQGTTKRSQSATVEFKKQQPCPDTGSPKGPCKGYAIDHVKPLGCGGSDAPGNMQWQTTAVGKAKDKWERKGC